MSVAFGPSSCSYGLVPKSKLLRNPEAQYSFVPTLGALRRLTLQEQAIIVAKTPPFGLKNKLLNFLSHLNFCTLKRMTFPTAIELNLLGQAKQRMRRAMVSLIISVCNVF